MCDGGDGGATYFSKRVAAAPVQAASVEGASPASFEEEEGVLEDMVRLLGRVGGRVVVVMDDGIQKARRAGVHARGRFRRAEASAVGEGERTRVAWNGMTGAWDVQPHGVRETCMHCA